MDIHSGELTRIANLKLDRDSALTLSSDGGMLVAANGKSELSFLDVPNLRLTPATQKEHRARIQTLLPALGGDRVLSVDENGLGVL